MLSQNNFLLYRDSIIECLTTIFTEQYPGVKLYDRRGGSYYFDTAELFVAYDMPKIKSGADVHQRAKPFTIDLWVSIKDTHDSQSTNDRLSEIFSFIYSVFDGHSDKRYCDSSLGYRLSLEHSKLDNDYIFLTDYVLDNTKAETLFPTIACSFSSYLTYIGV